MFALSLYNQRQATGGPLPVSIDDAGWRRSFFCMPGVAGIVWIWAGVVVCMEKGICKILQDASISIGFLWHTECVNVKNSVSFG